MPEAQSIKDLLQIRYANRHRIEAVNGNLGSALGLKRSADPAHPDNGKPAILVFVPQKIAPKWLNPTQRLPDRMSGPDGLECPVDVVEGSKLFDFPLLFLDDTGNPRIVNWTELASAPPLSAPKLALREALRGWSERISPGAQIAARDGTSAWFGTLGCFARERTTGRLGLVTNQHVANKAGQVLFFASTSARRLARVTKTFETVTDQARFGGLIDESNAVYRVDCAFAPLDSDIAQDDVDPRIPRLDDAGAIVPTEMGKPVPLDLDTMGPIGQRVIGIGRTRSFQRGTIVGFGYEFVDEAGESRYTDYLIVGDDPDQFSAPGDSGKLILTDETVPRPVALLWGGWMERLSNYREQQDWTYAIDINVITDLLGVDLVQ